MKENKQIEYYLDSRNYTNEEVEKSINETKKEFPNKNVKANVTLNEFGVYVVTFEFENKENFLNKIKIFFTKNKSKEQRKSEKIQKRFEKYSKSNVYGKYKSSGIYHPY